MLGLGYPKRSAEKPKVWVNSNVSTDKIRGSSGLISHAGNLQVADCSELVSGVNLLAGSIQLG